VHQSAAVQQLSAKVSKLSFEYLHIYSPKSGNFCRKNNKITSLMSCQRSDLRKMLKYSQRRDLGGIQWILWIHTDAAPALQSGSTNCWKRKIIPTDSLTGGTYRWLGAKTRNFLAHLPVFWNLRFDEKRGKEIFWPVRVTEKKERQKGVFSPKFLDPPTPPVTRIRSTRNLQSR